MYVHTICQKTWVYLECIVISTKEHGRLDMASSSSSSSASAKPSSSSSARPSSSTGGPSSSSALPCTRSTTRTRKSAFTKVSTRADDGSVEFRVVDEASGCILRQDAGGYVYSGSRAAAIGLGNLGICYKYMWFIS